MLYVMPANGDREEKRDWMKDCEDRLIFRVHSPGPVRPC